MLTHVIFTGYEKLHLLVITLKKDPTKYKQILFDGEKQLKTSVRQPVNFVAFAQIFDLLGDEQCDEIIEKVDSAWLFIFFTNIMQNLKFERCYPRAAHFIYRLMKQVESTLEMDTLGYIIEHFYDDKKRCILTVKYNPLLSDNALNELMSGNPINLRQSICSYNEYQYNQLDQMIMSKSYPLGEFIQYTYDHQGRRTGEIISYATMNDIANQTVNETVFKYNAQGSLIGSQISSADLMLSTSNSSTTDSMEESLCPMLFREFSIVDIYPNNFSTCKSIYTGTELVITLEKKPTLAPYLLPIFYLVQAPKDIAKLGITLIDIALDEKKSYHKSVLDCLERLSTFYLFPFKLLSIDTIKETLHELEDIKAPISFLLMGYLLTKSAEFHVADKNFSDEALEIMLLDAMRYLSNALTNSAPSCCETAKELLCNIATLHGDSFESIRKYYDKIQYQCGDKIDLQSFFKSDAFSSGIFSTKENTLANLNFNVLAQNIFDSLKEQNKSEESTNNNNNSSQLDEIQSTQYKK